MMSNPLVTTTWLAAHLDDPKVRIVDIRGHVRPASEPLPHYFNHYDDYLQNHIPGAAFVDWVHEITDPADPRHAQIAPAERYTAVMQRLGIDADTHVIAYDDTNGMFAARLWWSLNYYGHPQVSILEGGWQHWLAEQHPTTAEVPILPLGTLHAQPIPALYRDGGQVGAGLTDGTAQKLIDVRTPAEFSGKASRAARGGHIPGAFNLPRADMLDSDGYLLPPDALRAHFAALGVTTESDAAQVVFYCNGGVSASFGLLALRAAGFSGGSVYDGSWKEWGNDETRPIAT